MSQIWKYIAMILTMLGVGILTFNQRIMDAQAKVKYHKVTSMPKQFRGTWYGRDYRGKKVKMKVSSKRFGYSKYHKKPGKYCGGAAISERYFQSYKVTGAKANTMYLENGAGIQTIRKTTHNKKPILVQYNEQGHGFGYAI